jgi:hypothetical protein
MAVTISDVESLSSMGWEQLDSGKKEDLLDMADRRADLHSEQVSTLPTIEGDRDDFVKLIAAHFWELAEGGEATSESSTGGSVNYNIGNPRESVSYSQTRYGREAREHLRDEQQIGMVRTR